MCNLLTTVFARSLTLDAHHVVCIELKNFKTWTHDIRANQGNSATDTQRYE